MRWCRPGGWWARCQSPCQKQSSSPHRRPVTVRHHQVRAPRGGAGSTPQPPNRPTPSVNERPGHWAGGNYCPVHPPLRTKPKGVSVHFARHPLTHQMHKGARVCGRRCYHHRCKQGEGNQLVVHIVHLKLLPEQLHVRGGCTQTTQDDKCNPLEQCGLLACYSQ